MILKGFNKQIGEFKLVPLRDCEEDYQICKDIFTNYEIMSKSTIFGGDVVKSEKDMQKIFKLYINTWITNNLGEYKILNKNNDVLGIAGFIISKKDKNNNASVLNFGCYLKKESSISFTSEIIYLLTKFVFKTFQSVREIITYSLESNYTSQIACFKVKYNLLGKIKYNSKIITYFNFKKKRYDNNYNIVNLPSINKVVQQCKECQNIRCNRYFKYLELL